jgi:hypothetical protein
MTLFFIIFWIIRGNNDYIIMVNHPNDPLTLKLF